MCGLYIVSYKDYLYLPEENLPREGLLQLCDFIKKDTAKVINESLLQRRVFHVSMEFLGLAVAGVCGTWGYPLSPINFLSIPVVVYGAAKGFTLLREAITMRQHRELNKQFETLLATVQKSDSKNLQTVEAWLRILPVKTDR